MNSSCAFCKQMARTYLVTERVQAPDLHQRPTPTGMQLVHTEEVVQAVELDAVVPLCSVPVPSDADQHHQTTRTNAQ